MMSVAIGGGKGIVLGPKLAKVTEIEVVPTDANGIVPVLMLGPRLVVKVRRVVPRRAFGKGFGRVDLVLVAPVVLAPRRLMNGCGIWNGSSTKFWLRFDI